MAHAVIASRARVGVASPPVEVEADLAAGLPALAIAGLPETAVKEAKDRVRAALVNSSYEFPTARVTVNLAPADLPKDGGRYDLAIALGILVASGQLPAERATGHELLGELTLDSRLRPVTGALAAALEPAAGRSALVVAAGNAARRRLPAPRQSSGPSPSTPSPPICAATSRWHPSQRASRRPTSRRTWPMCAARPPPSGPWRWRPREAMAC